MSNARIKTAVNISPLSSSLNNIEGFTKDKWAALHENLAIILNKTSSFARLPVPNSLQDLFKDTHAGGIEPEVQRTLVEQTIQLGKDLNWHFNRILQIPELEKVIDILDNKLDNDTTEEEFLSMATEIIDIAAKDMKNEGIIIGALQALFQVATESEFRMFSMLSAMYPLAHCVHIDAALLNRISDTKVDTPNPSMIVLDGKPHQLSLITTAGSPVNPEQNKALLDEFNTKISGIAEKAKAEGKSISSSELAGSIDGLPFNMYAILVPASRQDMVNTLAHQNILCEAMINLSGILKCIQLTLSSVGYIDVRIADIDFPAYSNLRSSHAVVNNGLEGLKHLIKDTEFQIYTGALRLMPHATSEELLASAELLEEDINKAIGNILEGTNSNLIKFMHNNMATYKDARIDNMAKRHLGREFFPEEFRPNTAIEHIAGEAGVNVLELIKSIAADGMVPEEMEISVETPSGKPQGNNRLN